MNKLKTGIRDAMIKKKTSYRNPTFVEPKSTDEKLGLRNSKTVKSNKSQKEIKPEAIVEPKENANKDLDNFQH